MAWKKGTADNFLDFIDKVQDFATKTTKAGTVTIGVSNVGTGTVYGATATENAIAETWTVTCTTAGGNGVAVFSVVGSVSGALSTATAGTPYSSTYICFTILTGGIDFSIDDVFTFDTTTGETAKYECIRGEGTGNNLSNDYVTSMQWELIDSRQSIAQTSSSGGALLNQEVALSTLNNTDFTVCLWVFSKADFATYSSSVLSFMTAKDDVDYTFYIIQYNARIGFAIGEMSASYIQTTPYTLNTWHHISISYNRTTRAYVIYLNGIQALSGTVNSAYAMSNNIVRMGVGGFSFSRYSKWTNLLCNRRDIQIYTKIIDETEAASIAAGGTTTELAHHWLCDEGEGVQYAVDSVGGAAYNINVGPLKKELILKGLGDSGDQAIYTGVQSYTNASSYWNLILQGFTGYTESNEFANQPGAIGSPPAMLLQNSSFEYFIHSTPNRLVIYINSGGNDESAYMGWYIPYYSEDQWGYPMAIGGSSTSEALVPTDTSSSHTAWFNLSSALKVLVNGAWKSISTSFPRSVTTFTSTDHVESVDGLYPDFEFIPYSATDEFVFGPFEGVRVPVRANLVNSGDVLLSESKCSLVIGDTFRTGNGTIVAIDLSGD